MPAAATSRPPPPERQVELDDFLLDSLKSQWRNYRKEFKRCQKKFSNDAVHEVRIAIRRLLASLGLLGSILPPEHLHQAGRALKKRLKIFARLRDTHAQSLYVEKLRRAFPAARRYHAALARRERRLIKRVRRRLPRARDKRLAENISVLKEQLRTLARDRAHEAGRMAAVMAALRAAFAEAARRRRAIRADDTPTIHRTRVAFKKFRYMTEALQPLLPGVSRRTLNAMRDYQTRMGDIQDIEVLLGALDKFIAKQGDETRTWTGLRAELLRRRAGLVRRFLASAGRLDEFSSFQPSRVVRRRAILKAKP